MRAFVSMSHLICLLLAGFVSLIALGGCVSDEAPTLGERIAAIGDSHAQLAQDWQVAEAKKDTAEDDVRAAKKAIKQAHKDLDQANDDLDDANERVVEARGELAEAEGEAHRRGIAPAPQEQN